MPIDCTRNQAFAPDDPGHRCHLPGCERHIHPRLLLCDRHWRLVPVELKRAVWHHYQPGQETRKDPSPAYREAARQAVAAVVAQEEEKEKTVNSSS